MLGSFWRETAVARDELEWFATGHRLVEALVGLVRDGDAGPTAACSVAWAPRRGALYMRWPCPALAAERRSRAGRARRRRGRPRATSSARPSRWSSTSTREPAVRGGAARLEEEIDGGRGGPRSAPRPRRCSRRRARRRRRRRAPCSRAGSTRRRRSCSRTRDAEEERLVEAAFQGGAPRGRVEAALARAPAAPRGRREGHRPGEARARRGRARRPVGGRCAPAPAGLVRPPARRLRANALAAVVRPGLRCRA